MTFTELIKEVQALPLKEVRTQTHDYFECVIPVESEKSLYAVLENYFGPPFKPRNVDPSPEAQRYSCNYGGIEKNQIMYYVEKESFSNCALIWPWRDGKLATVKIAQGTIS